MRVQRRRARNGCVYCSLDVDPSRENRYDREARRCLASGGGFRRERRDAATWFRPERVPPELLAEVVGVHDARLARGDANGVLKTDRRARLSVVEPTTPGFPPLCVKEFQRPRVRQRLVDRLTGSRARRAWLGAHACRVRGIATPTPFGALEAGPRSYFVNEYLADAVPVVEWVAEHGHPLDPEARLRWEAFLDAAADFVGRLHAHRLRHRDLAPKNLLVRERTGRVEIFLIDLSDVRLGRRPSARFKIHNLGQLAHLPVPPEEGDKQRFFRRYVAFHPELDRFGTLREIAAVAHARRERWLAHGGRKWLAERRRHDKPV